MADKVQRETTAVVAHPTSGMGWSGGNYYVGPRRSGVSRGTTQLLNALNTGVRNWTEYNDKGSEEQAITDFNEGKEVIDASDAYLDKYYALKSRADINDFNVLLTHKYNEVAQAGGSFNDWSATKNEVIKEFTAAMDPLYLNHFLPAAQGVEATHDTNFTNHIIEKAHTETSNRISSIARDEAETMFNSTEVDKTQYGSKLRKMLTELQEMGGGLGVSKKETSGIVSNVLIEMAKLSGAPELLDVMNEPGPDGIRLRDTELAKPLYTAQKEAAGIRAKLEADRIKAQEKIMKKKIAGKESELITRVLATPSTQVDDIYLLQYDISRYSNANLNPEGILIPSDKLKTLLELTDKKLDDSGHPERSDERYRQAAQLAVGEGALTIDELNEYSDVLSRDDYEKFLGDVMTYKDNEKKEGFKVYKDAKDDVFKTLKSVLHVGSTEPFSMFADKFGPQRVNVALMEYDTWCNDYIKENDKFPTRQEMYEFCNGKDDASGLQRRMYNRFPVEGIGSAPAPGKPSNNVDNNGIDNSILNSLDKMKNTK